MIINNDSLHALKELDENSIDAVITDLQAGKAGEYLVCADLILKGHIAYPSEQGLPYDIVADINGKLTKVQVKTTRTHRATPQRKNYTPAYLFWIKRCGKHGAKEYTAESFDLMALVALDKKIISYIPASQVRKSMHLNETKMRALTLEAAL